MLTALRNAIAITQWHFCLADRCRARERGCSSTREDVVAIDRGEEDLPVTVWLWGRGRVLPEFTSGGDDRMLDPPKGFGPIKLLEAGACEIESTRLVGVLIRGKRYDNASDMDQRDDSQNGCKRELGARLTRRHGEQH